jgi:hypothetical protein
VTKSVVSDLSTKYQSQEFNSANVRTTSESITSETSTPDRIHNLTSATVLEKSNSPALDGTNLTNDSSTVILPETSVKYLPIEPTTINVLDLNADLTKDLTKTTDTKLNSEKFSDSTSASNYNDFTLETLASNSSTFVETTLEVYEMNETLMMNSSGSSAANEIKTSTAQSVFEYSTINIESNTSEEFKIFFLFF